MGEVFFFLFIAAMIVMVVGHGMWVVVAAIFRGSKPKENQNQFDPTLSDDRAATARYARHLRDRQLIDSDMHTQIMNAIAEDVHLRDAVTPEPIISRAEDSPSPDTPRASTPPISQQQTDEKSPVPTTSISQESMGRESSTPNDVQPQETVLKTLAMQMAQKHHDSSTATPNETDEDSNTLDNLQEIDPIEIPVVTTAKPVEPPTPKRPIRQVLATFMAQKNIRWGELIGGLLIVCCSAALVVSLWSQIQAIPILKFMIFTGMTAALFGGGLFVQHRWNVPTTGRAVLSIATLLVPLNFLAFAAFTINAKSIGFWTISIEAGTAILFAYLTWLAAKVVLPQAPRLMATGYVTTAATCLAMQFVPLQGPRTLLVAVAIPMSLYLITMLLTCRRLLFAPVDLANDSDGKQDWNLTAKSLYFMQFFMAFACLAPFGLAIHLTGTYRDALQCTAPLIALFASPAMLVSYLLWQRDEIQLTAPIRTLSATISLVALVLGGLALGLAWPVPVYLLPTLLVNAMTMWAVSRSARRWQIKRSWLTRVGLVWLSLAWIVLVGLLAGRIDWAMTDPRLLIQSLLSILSAKALILPVVLCALLSQWSLYRKDIRAAHGYWITCGLMGLVSVTLLTVKGFGLEADSGQITWVYVLYAVIALLAAWRLRNPLPTWCSCVMMQLALFEQLIFVRPFETFIWPTAILISASLFGVGVLLTGLLTGKSRRSMIQRIYSQPWFICSISLSIIAVILMSMRLSEQLLNAYYLRLYWVTAIWLILSILTRSRWLFAMGQLAMLGGLLVMQHNQLIKQLDWDQLPNLLSMPSYWQRQTLMIAGMSLFWLLYRLTLDKLTQRANGTSKLERLASIVNLPNVTMDMVLSWIAMASCIVFALWSVGIHIAIELGIDQRSADVIGSQISRSQHAAGWATWILLGIVSIIFGIRQILAKNKAVIGALAICWLCATALIAAQFAQMLCVVNAWRWLLGVTGAAYVTGLIITGKHRSAIASESLNENANSYLKQLGFYLFALPLLVLTAACAIAMVLVNPSIEVFFTDAFRETTYPQLFLHLQMYGPVALLLGCLFALGFSKRDRDYANAVAVLISITAIGIESCIFHFGGLRLSAGLIFALVQIHALVGAGAALIWDQLRRFKSVELSSLGYPQWPLLLSRISISIMLAIACLAVLAEPGNAPTSMQHAGSLWSFAAFILVELAILRNSEKRPRLTQPISLWMMMGVILIALACAPLDTGMWQCFHIISTGWLVVGVALLLTLGRYTHQLAESGWSQTFDTIVAGQNADVATIEHDLSCTNCNYNLRGLDRSGTCPECGESISEAIKQATEKLSVQWTARILKARTTATQSILGCVILAMVFALRSSLDDPFNPWWSMGMLLGVAAMSMALGAWAPRRAYAYLGVLAVSLGTTIGYAKLYWDSAGLSEFENIIQTVHLNMITVILSAFAWQWVERRFLRTRLSASPGVLPQLHHLVVIASTILLAGLAGMQLFNMASGITEPPYIPINGVATTGWIALVMATLLTLACIRESIGKHVLALLYVIGLTALCQLLTQSPIAPQSLGMVLALGLAGYASLMSVILRQIQHHPKLQGICDDNAFVPYTNIALSMLSVFLSFIVSVQHPIIMQRAVICLAPVIAAIGLLVLQRDTRWQNLRGLILAQLFCFPLLVSWIYITPDGSFVWPSRIIGYIQAFAFITLVMGIFVSRMPNGDCDVPDPLSWQSVTRRCMSVVSFLGLLAIGVVGFGQVQSLVQHQTLPLTMPMIIGLIVAYALLIVLCLLFALRDRFDVLRIPDAHKGAYVYIAQLLGGVLALHIRTTMPWLFHGLVTPFWPLVVLGIAVGGIAIGEMCTRRNLFVIGKPFTQTGTWLPLVACFDLIAHVSRIHFSLVLLAVGAIYAVLSVMRRSMLLGMIATFALNGSLWYLLHHTQGLGITEHPQLWIIPLAIAVLAAGYLNRQQLTTEQSRIIHYGCLLAIYLSSTLDIFLIGVAQAPWLPLVLAGLSIIGIFIGLARHIRSYMFLGTGFLCLSLLTMIWHAATNMGWTWIWYVAGIALGIGIITVFAMFEKKKNEMAKVIDEVKDWTS